MTGGSRPTILVSPSSRTPLVRQGNRLTTIDREESFPVEQEIAELMDREAADDALRHEMDVFDNLQIQGLSYFRPPIYHRMLGGLLDHVNKNRTAWKSGFRFAELGGGEGHCARYFLSHFEGAEVFVCDASRSVLERAPRSLQRICADITRPIFAPGALQAAAFWVSLHHLPEERRRLAFEELFRALEEGGVCIVFEPNDAFILRRLLFRSSLRRDVYADDQERAVDFFDIAAMARDAGFEELETLYVNPPYNPAFVRRLKRWRLYLPVVEALHALDLFLNGRQAKTPGSRMRYMTLYGMSFFRKPCGRTNAPA